MKIKLSLLFGLVLSATVGCAGAEDEIDVQAIQDLQEIRVKTQIAGACSMVPLNGKAWVDTKMPMLNGEAGADQITKDAYAEFMAELLYRYSELGKIGSVLLSGDDERDTPIVDEIQWELFSLTVDLEGMANLNQSSNFPVYFPPNNDRFLDDFRVVCDEFLADRNGPYGDDAFADSESSGMAENRENNFESGGDVDTEITTVEILEEELLGKTRGQVEQVLTEKGLRLDAITGNVAPSESLVATVYRVQPHGKVATNTLIAVYFYAAIP